MEERKKEGKLVRHPDGKIELSGDSEYCVDLYKGIELSKKELEKEEAEWQSDLFSAGQRGALFVLEKLDREILVAVKEHYKKKERFPTPTQVLQTLSSEHGNDKKVNYVTRRIEAGKPLSKCLEFFGGNYRGKVIRFTADFQKL